MANRRIVAYSLALLLPALCAAINNTWIFPEPDSSPVYNYIDIVNATWTSNLTNTYLVLWCQQGGSADNPFSSKYNQSVPASGNRLVSLDYDAQAYGCHFNVIGREADFNSGAVLIQVLKDANPVTWSQDTRQNAPSASGAATASQTASTVSPIAAATSQAPVPTTTSNSSENGGLSTGAKAGVGVAVALGVLAVGALTAFFVLRARRSKQQHVGKMAPGEDFKGDSVMYEPVSNGPMNEIPMELGAEQLIPEMAAGGEAHELPASVAGTHTGLKSG